MPDSMSKRLMLVLVLFGGCGGLMKPAEFDLVRLAFRSESMVDITLLINNHSQLSARASDMKHKVGIGGRNSVRRNDTGRHS